MTASSLGTGVAVDARALHASGIGRYLRELLAEWRATAAFSRLTLFGDPEALGAFLREHPSAMPTRVIAHRGASYSPAAQWSWIARARHELASGDVAFFPHWDAPIVGLPGRSVVTLHDLTPFRVRAAFGPARRAVGRAALARVLARAGAVICVSRAAATDVLNAYPGLGRRLHVVPNGVSARFADATTSPAPVAGAYLLWVGMLKPHKNPAAALGVLARVRAAGRPDVRLIVAGRPYPELQLSELVAARGLGDAVVAVGEVGDDVLRVLYANAGALIFPSRAEGFGLPVLEAMAAGAPVVASNIAAVAEVAGSAAPLLAPDDLDGMARAVLTLLNDPAARAAAVARGRARAAEFSWATSARATGAVIADVAARAPRARDASASVHRQQLTFE